MGHIKHVASFPISTLSILFPHSWAPECHLHNSAPILPTLCRLVADILNDLGTFLELLAPLFPHLFLAIVCAASISRVSS